MQLQAIAAVTAKSYADQKNKRFNDTKSHYVESKDRWDTTLSTLPQDTQNTINYRLLAELAEFKRRHPNVTCWQDILKDLPEAKTTTMVKIKIDMTMQRFLKHLWSCTILGKFNPLKVAPIQVYRPDPTKDEFVAWDGQHTLIALWLIAKYVLNVTDLSTIEVPIVIYRSTQKADMRDSFVGHNGGEYKTLLDTYDIIEQMIYGVRVDNSQNPEWILIEEKQKIVEKYKFFLTKKDLGDEHMPGAISRMQEFEKLNKHALESLCKYLVAVGATGRPVEEKEMVMMAYFFEKCYHSPLVIVDDKFITDVAGVTLSKFNADFSPNSKFWTQATKAYQNWHSLHVQGVNPKFSKEPIHGFPFLIAQLNKDLPQHNFPQGITNSPFQPAKKDLF